MMVTSLRLAGQRARIAQAIKPTEARFMIKPKLPWPTTSAPTRGPLAKPILDTNPANTTT